MSIWRSETQRIRRLLRAYSHRGCRIARPHLGVQWPSRLVATAAENRLSNNLIQLRRQSVLFYALFVVHRFLPADRLRIGPSEIMLPSRQIAVGSTRNSGTARADHQKREPRPKREKGRGLGNPRISLRPEGSGQLSKHVRLTLI
jgi:hypothetical protein